MDADDPDRSDPTTIDELLAARRTRETAAIDGPDRSVAYRYDELVTDAWKAGNLLRHYGVRPGARVAVVPTRTAKGVLATLGGMAAGATVELAGSDASVSARALVAPPGEYDTTPGCSQLAYGEGSTQPDVANFERELWSENPIEPPGEQAPDDAALCVDGRRYSHRGLLETARTVASEHSLSAADTVGITGSVGAPGGFVAGVLAPLSVGGTIRFDDSGSLTVRDRSAADGIAVSAVTERLPQSEY